MNWTLWRAYETPLFLTLNHATSGVLPDMLWLAITALGAAVVVLVLPLAVWKPHRLSFFLFSALGAALVSYALKEVIGGQALRPPGLLAPESFHLIGQAHGRSGMPSGHTLSAFLLAGWGVLLVQEAYQKKILSLLSAKVWIGLCLSVASLIGLSRIACGVHWVSDVLVGAVVGGLVCMCCHWLCKHIRLSPHRYWRIPLWGLLWVINAWYALGGEHVLSLELGTTSQTNPWLIESGFVRLYAVIALLMSLLILLFRIYRRVDVRRRMT